MIRALAVLATLGLAALVAEAILLVTGWIL